MSGRGGDFDESEPTNYERQRRISEMRDEDYASGALKPHWREFEMKIEGPRLGYVTFASHEVAAQFENSDGTPLQPLPEIGPNVFETRGPIRPRRVVDSATTGQTETLSPALHQRPGAVSEADSCQQAPVSTSTNHTLRAETSIAATPAPPGQRDAELIGQPVCEHFYLPVMMFEERCCFCGHSKPASVTGRDPQPHRFSEPI